MTNRLRVTKIADLNRGVYNSIVMIYKVRGVKTPLTGFNCVLTVKNKQWDDLSDSSSAEFVINGQVDQDEPWRVLFPITAQQSYLDPKSAYFADIVVTGTDGVPLRKALLTFDVNAGPNNSNSNNTSTDGAVGSTVIVNDTGHNKVIVDCIIGERGATGPGVLAGGTTDQVLVKASDEDFDTKWSNAAGRDVGWGEIQGNLSDQADLQAALDGKADDADLDNYVELSSPTIQVIDSNLAMGENKRIYATDSNQQEHELIGLNEYGAGQLQSEIGSPNAPACINSSMVAGWSEDPHVKHTYKDLDGVSHDERQAWVSDIAAETARAETAEGTKVSKAAFGEDHMAMTAITIHEDTSDTVIVNGWSADVNADSGEPVATQVALPVVSGTQAGIAPSSLYNAVTNNTAAIQSLNNEAFAVTGFPATPTQTQITNAWLTASGETEVHNGAVLYDIDNNVRYGYFQIDASTFQWFITNSGGGSGVGIATNNSPGLVKGDAATTGKIFVEADGTQSLNGYDAIVTDIANLQSGKQDSLTFDSTPTEGSTNPVTSEGIKAYVDAAIAAYVPKWG